VPLSAGRLAPAWQIWFGRHLTEQEHWINCCKPACHFDVALMTRASIATNRTLERRRETIRSTKGSCLAEEQQGVTVTSIPDWCHPPSQTRSCCRCAGGGRATAKRGI